MQPNDQPQIQPDYSFIVDQTLPPTSNKGSSKKKLLLFGLVLLLVISTLGLAIYTRTSESVKRSSSTSFASLAEQHSRLVAAGSLEESKKMYSGSPDPQIYTVFWQEFMKKNYRLAVCKSTDQPPETDGNIVRVSLYCPFSDSEAEGKVIDYSFNSNTALITKVTDKANENLK